jgi:hypothetical protein
VAGEEDRHAAIADEAPQQVEDLDDAERVDRRRRLVEDQDVGVFHESVRDAEALEHAPRVRLDLVVGSGGQADLLEDLLDRRLGELPRDAIQAGGVAEVLAAGQVGVEADGIGHITDAAFDVERIPCGVEPDDPGLAAGRLGQPEQHQDRRRLTGAVLAEQPEDLARLDLEVEPVDGDELAVVLGEVASPDRDELAPAVDGDRARVGLSARDDALLGRQAWTGRHRRPYVRKT